MTGAGPQALVQTRRKSCDMSEHGHLEILPPDLIEEFPHTVREVDLLAKRLGHEWGWHYLLDIVWILSNLDVPPGGTILDAGAGNGLLQFALAARGYHVISVDVVDRRRPVFGSLAFPVKHLGGARYDDAYIRYLKKEGLAGSGWSWSMGSLVKVGWKIRKIGTAGFGLPWFWLSRVVGLRKTGRISYYRADMADMTAVGSHSVDGVVSLSAVEHMQPAKIPDALREFRRVLRRGKKMFVTTSAAKDKDWFHTPSRGWCFVEQTIRSLFELSSETPSNWSMYDVLLSQFKASRELRQRLAARYRRSGQNGMPWGVWDPKYLPVGIIVQTAT